MSGWGFLKGNETINKQHKNDSADRSSVLYVTLSCIEFIGGVMEKIYIAELIKDCPKGTKLYTTVWGDVEFIEYNSSLHLIKVSVPDSVVNQKLLYGDGSYTITGECILFPSKENRDWSKFQIFKDGDILTYMFYNKPTIYIYRKNGGYNTSYYVAYSSENEKFYNIPTGALAENRNDVRFANEEEKQKLFDAIKANGYKWNPETKTLEKLVEPKFKVGDRVKKNKDYISGIVTDIFDDSFKVTYKGGSCSYVQFHYQHEWKLVPNKFDINTLKPFDKVLVRHNKDNKWCGSFFSHIDKEHHSHCYKHVTTSGKSYPYCIPYESNEHLLGTTNDCNEYYKTWE